MVFRNLLNIFYLTRLHKCCDIEATSCLQCLSCSHEILKLEYYLFLSHFLKQGTVLKFIDNSDTINSLMSVSIDPHEVLEHLRYLGYHDITKEQLKDFIKDLKRLIKYDQRKESRKQQASVACETSFPVNDIRYDPPKQNLDYRHSSLPGNRESTVYTYGSPNSSTSHPGESIPCQESNGSPSQRSYHPNDYLDEEFTYRECDNKSCCCCKKLNDKNHQKEPEKKLPTQKPIQPTPSFIRPGMRKPSKCDPVALYHYYQSQWARRPLPGEDPRSDLRWAIRTRLAHQQPQNSQTKSTNEGKPRKEWVS